MHLLPRVRYILEVLCPTKLQQQPAARSLVLAILCRVAQHSRDSASLIVLTPRLLSAIMYVLSIDCTSLTCCDRDRVHWLCTVLRRSILWTCCLPSQVPSVCSACCGKSPQCAHESLGHSSLKLCAPDVCSCSSVDVAGKLHTKGVLSSLKRHLVAGLSRDSMIAEASNTLSVTEQQSQLLTFELAIQTMLLWRACLVYGIDAASFPQYAPLMLQWLSRHPISLLCPPGQQTPSSFFDFRAVLRVAACMLHRTTYDVLEMMSLCAANQRVAPHVHPQAGAGAEMFPVGWSQTVAHVEDTLRTVSTMLFADSAHQPDRAGSSSDSSGVSELYWLILGGLFHYVAAYIERCMQQPEVEPAVSDAVIFMNLLTKLCAWWLGFDVQFDPQHAPSQFLSQFQTFFLNWSKSAVLQVLLAPSKQPAASVFAQSAAPWSPIPATARSYHHIIGGCQSALDRIARHVIAYGRVVTPPIDDCRLGYIRWLNGLLKLPCRAASRDPQDDSESAMEILSAAGAVQSCDDAAVMTALISSTLPTAVHRLARVALHADACTGLQTSSLWSPLQYEIVRLLHTVAWSNASSRSPDSVSTSRFDGDDGLVTPGDVLRLGFVATASMERGSEALAMRLLNAVLLSPDFWFLHSCVTSTHSDSVVSTDNDVKKGASTDVLDEVECVTATRFCSRVYHQSVCSAAELSTSEALCSLRFATVFEQAGEDALTLDYADAPETAQIVESLFHETERSFTSNSGSAAPYFAVTPLLKGAAMDLVPDSARIPMARSLVQFLHLILQAQLLPRSVLWRTLLEIFLWGPEIYLHPRVSVVLARFCSLLFQRASSEDVELQTEDNCWTVRQAALSASFYPFFESLLQSFTSESMGDATFAQVYVSLWVVLFRYLTCLHGMDAECGLRVHCSEYLDSHAAQP